MARLSIILPVLGAPAQMEDTLVSVLENRPADCEILVVLNQSYDDPYDLAGEVSFHCVADQCWTAMVNRALAVCRAPIANVLRCGVLVQEGWAEAALARFDDPSVAAVAPLVLEAERPERIVSAGWRYGASGMLQPLAAGRSTDRAPKAFQVVDACDLASVFVRRDAVETIGGVSLDVGDRMAGADAALALRQAGYRCLVEPASRVLASAACRGTPRPFRRGWDEERFFWRWAPASGWPGALVGHALAVAGEGIVQCARPMTLLGCLAGRLAAALTALGHRRHWRGVRRWSDVPPRQTAARSSALSRTGRRRVAA